MSAVATSSRARRGRVLIVGDVPALVAVASHLQSSASSPGSVIVAHNLFDALGQSTIAPAGMPIVTVVLSEQSLPPSESGPHHAIEAIRRLDPSVRIIVISDRAVEGADDCIQPPISPADLARIFDDEAMANLSLTDGVGIPEAPSSAAAPQHEPAGLGESMIEGGIKPSPHRHEMESKQGHMQKLTEPMPTARASYPMPPSPPPGRVEPRADRAPATESATGNQEQLGDIDLVEAVMTGLNLARDVALRLMMQQTGWRDLELDVAPLATVDSSPTSRNKNRLPASIPVEFNDQTFGVLKSSLATEAQLQPWADWLARWLQLDLNYHDFRIKSFQDDLTSAGNRRFFDMFIDDAIGRAARERRAVTLMVFDIDNFKSFNDQFGHDAGDDILRETVKLMQSVIRQGDRVCRIGGDEFVVVFADPEAPREAGSKHPESIEMIAKRFQDQICKLRFPKLGPEAPGTLTISAGLATYPWDGTDPESLLKHADELALESKRKGKNIITFGQGAMRACRPET